MPNDRVPKHKQRLATDQGQDRQMANAPAPAKGTGKKNESTGQGKNAAGTKPLNKESEQE